jgi:type IV pilus assembly protein PilB
MSIPSDARDLFRTVIQNLDDEMPRLVFADWLEDTGLPHNTAWARYLRLNTFEQGRFLHSWEREKLARRIHARLTLPCELFLAHREALLKLLPPTHITLKLDSFEQPNDHQFYDQYFSLNDLLLLHVDPETIYFAAALRDTGPWYQAVTQRMGYIFDRYSIIVNAPVCDIRQCLARQGMAHATTLEILTTGESIDLASLSLI